MNIEDVVLKPEFGKWDSAWSSFIQKVGTDVFLNSDLEAARDKEAKRLKLAISLISDLKKQGWKSSIASNCLVLTRPDENEYETKESIRKKHLVGRDLQLSEPAIREFIHKMECRRLTKSGWKSILNLIADGRKILNDIELKSCEVEQYEELPIQPYIQIARKDLKCEFTGLFLLDIWRYFRYTWSSEYKPIPGRQIAILIRDKKGTDHPIIGIACASSPVLNLRARDELLGLTVESIQEFLISLPAHQACEWIDRHLAKSIKDVYCADLEKDGIIQPSDWFYPRPELQKSLLLESERQKSLHADSIKRGRQKEKNSAELDEEDLKSPEELLRACLSPLFRSKRARTLAAYFKAKEIFFFAKNTPERFIEFRNIKNNPDYKTLVSFILGFIKNEKLGSGVLDLSVCGAISPYTKILGGKLVSLLVASPEFAVAYNEIYGKTPSIIASATAGRPIIKPCSLFAITTTSLYSSGSSQYNRIKIPAGKLSPQQKEDLKYIESEDKTKGFGTFQFSKTTSIKASEVLNEEDSISAHRINSIFGEGTSPKMRKMRHVMELLGIRADVGLVHSCKRIFYICPLIKNISTALLSDLKPLEYILPQEDKKKISEKMSVFWFNRWVLKRTQQDKVKEDLSTQRPENELHEARVKLPSIELNEGTLFDA